MGYSLTRDADYSYRAQLTPQPSLFRKLFDHPANRIIAAIIILWALMIAPDPDPGPEVSGPVVATPPTAPPASIGEAKGRGPMKRFETNAGAPIDREAFILSFKRQAAREALPCLRGAKPSPASANVMATLLKSGKLKNLRPIGFGDGFPDCLPAAIAAMDFTSVAASLTEESQELTWRIDW